MTDSASQQDAPANPLLPDRILYRGLYRQSRLPSCRLNLKDIPKLYEELQEPAREAVNQQLQSSTRRPDMDPNEWDEAVTRAKEVSGLAVTVMGKHGQQLVAQSVDELSIEKLPEGVSLVVFDSGVAFQKHYGQLPLNRFKLTLDFSEPPGYKLGSYNPMDEPTPNKSSLEIIAPKACARRSVLAR